MNKRGIFLVLAILFFGSLVFAVSDVINSPLNQSYNSGNITFNVTAIDSDGIDTCIYNLNAGENYTLGKNLHWGKGNYTNFSFELNLSTRSNVNPLGMTQNGTYFWVTDSAYDEVWQFYMNGTYTGFNFSTSIAGAANPRGITQNGTYFWIADLSDDLIYKFYMNGTYTGETFNTSAEAGLLNPIGITQNGTYFWITSNLDDDEVYKFYMNGTYTGDHFDTAVAGIIDTRHITHNGTYFWITGSTTNSIYQFYMNGTYTGFNFSSDPNDNPFGITQNGTYFWTVSNLQKFAYRYAFDDIYYDYYNATNSSIPDGSYNLSVYCNDTLGNVELNNSISFSVDTSTPAVTPSSTTDSSGRNPKLNYRPEEEQLVIGYTRLFGKGDKIFYNEIYAEIINVNSLEEKVSFLLGDINYDLNAGEPSKIDSDDDGYYDLEISMNGIKGNSADMTFREIYEEIPSENVKGSEEEVSEIVKKKNKARVYIIGGIILLGIIGYFCIRKKKLKIL